MTSYRVPCGKHKDRVIDVLPDNVLAGLLWAYRPDGLNDEELHGECFAVLYERHGTARAVVALVDRFEKWARPTKKGGRKLHPPFLRSRSYYDVPDKDQS